MAPRECRKNCASISRKNPAAGKLIRCRAPISPAREVCQPGAQLLRWVLLMERQLLLGSTLCFLVAVAHTLATLREGVFRPRRFNFIAIALGFALESAFLYVRGHAVGRC